MPPNKPRRTALPKLSVLQVVGAVVIVAIATAASNGAPRPAGPGTANGANLEQFAHGQLFHILGKDVRGADGTVLGRVIDLLVDGDGQPRAVLIDFGGFLGVGSRKIAVDWSALHFSPAVSDEIVLDLSRDQIKAAPEYKESREAVAVVGPPHAQGGR
jgi:PRC-barrel domain